MTMLEKQVGKKLVNMRVKLKNRKGWSVNRQVMLGSMTDSLVNIQGLSENNSSANMMAKPENIQDSPACSWDSLHNLET